jgi:hypothetical protein
MFIVVIHIFYYLKVRYRSMSIPYPLFRACFLMLVGAFLALPAGADVFEKMFSRTQEEAASGNVNSMYELGRLYELGVGAERNPAESLRWYERAAAENHPRALFKVGEANYRGILVPRDYGKAHDAFVAAAKGGIEEAREYLARMYELGLGVAKDPVAAARWAAEPGSPEAEEAVPDEETAVASVEVETVQAPQEASPAPANTAAEPAAQTEAEPEPQAKPEPQSTPKPQAKPQPKAKPKPSKPLPPIQIVKRGEWQKKKRAALYLPSASTKCQHWGTELICVSKKIRGQQYSTPYLYRVQSTLRSFGDDGSFTIDYQFMLDEILLTELAGYGAGDTGETATAGSISAELSERAGSLSCKVASASRVDCEGVLGKQQRFDNAGR